MLASFESSSKGTQVPFSGANKKTGKMPAFLICAPGRIRTSVAARAIGLQPIAIDHSATDALYVPKNVWSTLITFNLESKTIS